MEVEEPRPSRVFLVSLGLVGILLAGLVAAELVLRLQPSLTPACTGCTVPTGPVVSMPAGLGSNPQLNFSPGRITVVIGVNNTVIFENLDAVPHTVTASDHSFDSGSIAGGATWNYTFSSPGNFSFYCQYHSWMKGTVVVKQGAPGSLLGLVTIPSGTGSNPDLSFQPKDFLLIIGVNNTVKFVNLDSVPHSVTADDGSFDSGSIAGGHFWTHTFTTTGTFTYHCSYHSWMKGTMTIVSPKS
jgi:plastocyanin